MNKDHLIEEKDSETGQGLSAQQKVKKIKKPKDKVSSSTNLTASTTEKPSAASKRSSKVGTYKEKIKDIVSEDDELNQEEEEMIEGLENIDDDEARKSEKSRLSAKMTRKRRKLYIQLLEKKVKQLGDELDQSKLKISAFEQNQKQRQNSEIMTQLLQERQKLFDKLEEKIKEKDDIEIQCTMDSLRLRLGLSGKTRNSALGSFYDEIVKLMMPFHMKYLIWIATENLDIFQAERDTDSTDSVWFQNSGMSDQQISEIRQKILESKKDYDDILHQLDMLKQKMNSQNEFAQNFIDDLRNFFPPINIAKFLVDLDKKRNLYERNNLYPDCYWQKLQQKNSTLNPLKNNQSQGMERPFQTNPNILSANTQVKQEIVGDVKMRTNSDLQGQMMRNNMQSLDSSQCSFSVDQLGLSGFINHQQQQQLLKQSSDIKSEDGRLKSKTESGRQLYHEQGITQHHGTQQNGLNQIQQNQIMMQHPQQYDRLGNQPSSQQNIQSQQSFDYEKYQYSSGQKDNQSYMGQYSNESLQQQNQFERPQIVPQYSNNQNKYGNQNQNNQQFHNNNNMQDQQFQNQNNLQNRNPQLQQQQQHQQINYNNNTNNVNQNNASPFEYIPHSGSFQFQDPNQNFDLFLLQRDLS